MAHEHIARRGVLAAGLAAALPADAQTPGLTWRTLAPGLEHGRTSIIANIGDRQLHVLRIDPARYAFRLLTGAVTGEQPKTARQWARDHGLVAATNAGMFHPGGLPVGFAKAEGRIVQPRVTADRSVFVFGDGGAHLLDRACEAFDAAEHANALQGIRMVSCVRRNVWSQQARMWSTACLAEDGAGNILFLHLRSPLSVHDFIAMVLRQPLDIARAMYLEGGPEATFYAHAGDAEIERFGSYETGFNENDDVDRAWPLPNVLGVVAR